MSSRRRTLREPLRAILASRRYEEALRRIVRAPLRALPPRLRVPSPCKGEGAENRGEVLKQESRRTNENLGSSGGTLKDLGIAENSRDGFGGVSINSSPLLWLLHKTSPILITSEEGV